MEQSHVDCPLSVSPDHVEHQPLSERSLHVGETDASPLKTAAKKAQISIRRIRAFVSYLKEDIPEFQDDRSGRYHSSIRSSSMKSKNVIRTTQRAGSTPSSTITTRTSVAEAEATSNETDHDRLGSIRIFERLVQYHTKTKTADPDCSEELKDLSLYVESYRRKTLDDDEAPKFLKKFDDNDNHHGRSQLFYFAVKPLLNDLVQAYNELDQANIETIENMQEECSGSTESAKEKKNEHGPRKKNNKKKPKAPPGLLSLADYTDVACLLEFLVSTFIVPHLDKNILVPISKRIKLLPKSLRGRLNNNSLLWGSSYHEEERRQRQQSKVIGATSTGSPSKQTKVPVTQVTRAIIELHESSLLLANVCSMDRFMPMMLPRHLADIYAGLAQTHHMDDLLLKMRQKKQQGSSHVVLSSSLPCQEPKGLLAAESMEVWQLELYHKLRLSSLLRMDDSTNILNESFRSMNQIDATMIIKSYQTVLLSGSSTPLWVRRQVSKELSILAQTSHLDAIVAVFVKAADHLPGADMTAAASRLARALLVGATVTVTTNSSDLGNDNKLAASEGDEKATSTKHTHKNTTKSNLEPIFQQLFQMTSDFVTSVSTTSQNRMSSAPTTTSSTPMTSLAGPTTAACLIPLLVPNQIKLVEEFWLQPLVNIIYQPILLQQTKHRTRNNSINDRETTMEVVVTDYEVAHFLHCCHVWLCMTCPPTKDVCQLLLTSRRECQQDVKKSFWHAQPSVFQLLLWIVAGAPLSRDAEIGRRILGRILETCMTAEAETRDDSATASSYSSNDIIETLLSGIAIIPTLDAIGHLHHVFSLSFCPSPYGGCEIRLGGNPSNNDSLRMESIESNHGTIDSIDTRVKGIEANAKVIVQVMKAVLNYRSKPDVSPSKGGKNKHNNNSNNNVNSNLIGLVFETVLRRYISSLSTKTDNSTTNSEDVAAMILLPMLLEEFDAVALLGSSSPIPVFRMIRSVLKLGVTTCSDTTTKEEDSLLDNHGQRNNVTMQNNPTNDISNEEDPNSGMEMLLSTCSLCLSLLVCILELGSQHRPKEEEDYIKSFQPILTRYMEFAGGSDHAKETKETWSELAEMSAHAGSLIMSRGVSSIEEEEEKVCDSDNEDEKWDYHDDEEKDGGIEDENSHYMKRQIRMAEKDLNSNMPPIRARGVSSLTRMARAITEKHDDDIRMKCHNIRVSSERSRPLITEISSDGEAVVSDFGDEHNEREDETTRVAEQILMVALKALLDDESYVYLAAIQAISALCDTNPSYFLPKIIEAAISGCVEEGNGHNENKIQLEIGQRVKLTEAILFAIRRRGLALGNYIPKLIPLLLYGSYNKQNHDPTTANLENLRSFQEQTHNFLQTGVLLRTSSVDDSDVELNNSVAALEDKLTRINVGGPVFQLEELSALRSGSILCLAEIVGLVSPVSVSCYIYHMVKLCINALHLEHERPIRRATSVLVREIYSAALHETYEVLPKIMENNNHKVMPLTVALLLSDESHLFDTLSSIADQIKTGAGEKLYDAATTARCREALEARAALIESGGFDLANTLVQAKKQLQKELARAPKVVQNMTNGSS